MLQAVKRARLYEEVMVQLAELIRQGQLRPGDRLPSERELSARLHVSRATLREALRSMQLQGLVESRHGAGSFIVRGRAEELALALNHLALHDIFELRMLIEPSIAALAAQRATAQDTARLDQILHEQEQQTQRNLSTAKADIDFHSALADATHNRALLQLGAHLIEVLSPSRKPSLQTPQRAQLSLVSHRRIVEAIQGRNPAEARQAMEEHIRRVDAVLFGLPVDSIPLSFVTIPGSISLSNRQEAKHD
jgi:GntR family transcriptional regulator, transcriptional repressor for pyruvate dehydrogenase complex